MRLPLQGLSGDPISDMLGGTLDKAIETVIIRAMPIVERQIQPTVRPLQIMSAVTLGLAGAAAVFGFLTWRAKT